MTRTPGKLIWTAVLFTVIAVHLPQFRCSLTHADNVSLLRPTALITERVKTNSIGYSVRWLHTATEARKATVQVSGLTADDLKALQAPAWKLTDWQRLLAVYAEQTDAEKASDLPPVIGTYHIQSGYLGFVPRFPLDPGVAYHAVFYPGQLPGAQGASGAAVTAIYRIPAMPSVPSTVVKHVFPSAAVLPENLLKFYVYFTAPMSRGRIYEYVHLRNDDGKEIELPFLEIDEELWDPTMTRLTLFIDPGRIKRGVLPLEEIGPALEAGQTYSLVIDSNWKDGAGIPLQRGFEKRFRVSAPDRIPPDPSRWRIQPPLPGTQAPLVVTFPEPMDQALAQRVIRVTGDSHEVVSGKVTLEGQEERWVFVPASPWRAGKYQLAVPVTIEDLAGNNIGKPFEVDLFGSVERRPTTPTVRLPFEVR